MPLQFTMANDLHRGKDHSDLDSMHDQSVKFSNNDDPGHKFEREHLLANAPNGEPGNYWLVQNQESKPDGHDDDVFFTDDELVELEFLRDQEIDGLVENGLLPKEDRWNVECRQCFTLTFPEITLDIVTGDWYPVKNISLPRVVVDQLRVALRGIHESDKRENTFKRWGER